MQGQLVNPVGDTRPDAWVIGTDIADLIAATEACGFRVARRLAVGEASAALIERRSVPLVLFAVSDVLSDDGETILDILNDHARDGRTAAIISCHLPVLDAVVSRITAPFTTLVCDPTPTDLVLSILASTQGAGGVAENGAAENARQLLRLTDEVARIARVLAGVQDEKPAAPALLNDTSVSYRARESASPAAQITAPEIRAMIRWRRKREAVLPGDYFADPAWDMILDLAAAHIERVDVSVSSLCIAAAVPATTALRAIKTLTDAGVFVRVNDPHDGRRVYIRLVDAVAARAMTFLTEAGKAGAALI